MSGSLTPAPACPPPASQSTGLEQASPVGLNTNDGRVEEVFPRPLCLTCSKHLIAGKVVCVGNSRFAGKCTGCQRKKKVCREVPSDFREEVGAIQAAWGDDNITLDVREQLVVRAGRYVYDVEAYLRREKAARERPTVSVAAAPASAPQDELLLEALQGIQYELHAFRRQFERDRDLAAYSDLEDE